MSNNMDRVIDNLKQPSIWMRLFFMVIFALVVYFVLVVLVGVLILAQALFAIITGAPNHNLRNFGAAIGQYIFQILNYLTFNSEEKPFPFSEFPELDLEENVDTEAPSSKNEKMDDKSDITKGAPKKSAKRKVSSN